MAIRIKRLATEKIIAVTYTPEIVTKEDLAEQRISVAAELAEHKIKKVLIDASALKQLPPIGTLYDHNSKISAEEIFRPVKFAVICSLLGEDEIFLETSGLNRGVQIKCFTCKESALRWLAKS
jgi:hypothetical protein